MKVNELKKYKPLDITQISGSPWNSAEKVLGLDDKDKVVMAEPDEVVTPEDVQSAITQAMEAETARTEDTYAKKGELPPLDDYYTKEETDAAITSATQDMATETWVQNQGYLTEHQDLSAYAKTTAVTQDIQTAMASETARTEDTYAKKSDIPDLDNYYTKSETDEAIAEAVSGISLDGYWTSGQTKDYVDGQITGATQDMATKTWVGQNYLTIWETSNEINSAMATETARTENTYAKKTDIPSLEGYATEAYVTAATEDMATKTWVGQQGYAVSSAVTEDINTEIANETARTENTYAKPGDIPSLDDYWTSAQTENAITAATEGLATEAWVTGDTDTRIGTAMASETARTESVYAKKTDVPSLDGYWTSAQTQNAITAATDDMATKTWVGEQGYLTEHQDISGKLDVSVFTGYTGTTETALNGKVGLDVYSAYTGSTATEISGKLDTTAYTQGMASETARTESTYAKKTELNGYATKEYVDDNLSGYTSGVSLEITGVSNNVSIWVKPVWDDPRRIYFSGTNFNNIYVLNHSDITTEQEEIFGLSIDGVGYYPTTGGNPEHNIPAEVPATGAVFEISTTVRNVGWYFYDASSPLYFIIDTTALTASFTSTLPSSVITVPGKVDKDVYSAYTASTATALSGKVDNSVFTGYTGDTQTALNGKVGLDVYSAYTGSTATALAGKQETLVSGTNIKTINNESILGSGNIVIQGGGGGGETVVELTQAQYEALNPPAQDTTYIITDAETVDLNDYAMASGLTELSGTVETLSSTKADKVNTTARSAPYLPSWNAQGIITGSSTYYEGAFNMNGTALGSVIKTGNSVGATWYAPTSAGTAGQPLLSNGSGAPVWGVYKFAFITQTQYDALSTKDATTIYFITG